MLKNEIVIEELLELVWSIAPSKFNDQYTKSHYFLMPLLGLHDRPVIEFNRHYVNCFIDDELRPVQNENLLLMLFKTTEFDQPESITWERLHNKLTNTIGYAYHYYIGNNLVKNQVMYAFKLPSTYENDYKILYESAYSKTSSSYKKRVLQYFSSNDDVYQIMKGILYKEAWLQKAVEDIINTPIPKGNECWDQFISSREIFRWEAK